MLLAIVLLSSCTATKQWLLIDGTNCESLKIETTDDKKEINQFSGQESKLKIEDDECTYRQLLAQ